MTHNGTLLLLLLLLRLCVSSSFSPPKTTANTSPPRCRSCKPTAWNATDPGSCCLNASGPGCARSLEQLRATFNFTSLQVLDLSRCGPRSVDIPAVPALRTVYLVGNALTKLPEPFLGEARDLAEVYLGENMLTHLPRSITHRGLTTLDARANPIECDCDLYEAVKRTADVHYSSSSSSLAPQILIDCAIPESLSGQSLTNVSREHICKESHTAVYACVGTVAVALIIAALYLGCKRHLDPVVSSCSSSCRRCCCPGHKSGLSSRIRASDAEHDSYIYRPSPRREREFGGGGDRANAGTSDPSPYENWPLAKASSSSASLSAEASAATPGTGGSRSELSAAVSAGFDRRAGLLLQMGTGRPESEYQNLPTPNRSKEHAMAEEEEEETDVHVEGEDEQGGGGGGVHIRESTRARSLLQPRATRARVG
uniref:Uncharacterized protein LOC116951971 n=1 Tax=Petromyzon marinus TaxID=7757 RepID=A0AAJ7TZ83_PETMA|nr:uncharacterized protein LOC116951971 [Petromyzon marinus]